MRENQCPGLEGKLQGNPIPDLDLNLKSFLTGFPPFLKASLSRWELGTPKSAAYVWLEGLQVRTVMGRGISSSAMVM